MIEKYNFFINKNKEYEGNNKFCNICGHRFSHFKTFGKNKVEIICPLCGSFNRHRHLYIHLLPLYPFLKNKKILHVAPEIPIKEFLSTSSADYYDIDLNPNKARYREDITALSFCNDFFNYIICIHVLEHICEDIKAMQEMYRVLKKGGTAFLSVPFQKEAYEDNTIVDPNLRKIAFGQCDHVRWYNLPLFVSRLNSVGFDTQQISLPNLFPSYLSLEANLNDIIVLAKKT